MKGGSVAAGCDNQLSPRAEVGAKEWVEIVVCRAELADWTKCEYCAGLAGSRLWRIACNPSGSLHDQAYVYYANATAPPSAAKLSAAITQYGDGLSATVAQLSSGQ